uniref:BRCT domain-containing protein n=1 Tax=Angiostrongylus cantonensis TaxID=6313 RepID=A0A0K0D5R8_ANGCA
MDIAGLTELNGGRFFGDMKRSECTHLIADKIRGVKFKKSCRIWVCGADQTRFNKWKRILDRSRATRVPNVEAASHVVVVNVSLSERTRLIQAQFRGVHIVRAKWVAACFIQKDQVPLKEFLWDPSDNVIQSVCSSTSAQRSEEIHDRLDSGLSPRSSREATNSNDLGASDYLNLTAFYDVLNDPSLSNIFRTLENDFETLVFLAREWLPFFREHHDVVVHQIEQRQAFSIWHTL